MLSLVYFFYHFCSSSVGRLEWSRFPLNISWTVLWAVNSLWIFRIMWGWLVFFFFLIYVLLALIESYFIPKSFRGYSSRSKPMIPSCPCHILNFVHPLCHWLVSWIPTFDYFLLETLSSFHVHDDSVSLSFYLSACVFLSLLYVVPSSTWRWHVGATRSTVLTSHSILFSWKLDIKFSGFQHFLAAMTLVTVRMGFD